MKTQHSHSQSKRDAFPQRLHSPLRRLLCALMIGLCWFAQSCACGQLPCDQNQDCPQGYECDVFRKQCFNTSVPCLERAVRVCYEGPKGTENVGSCETGRQTCNERQEWSTCKKQVLPKADGCNGKDDNCDGTVDEGCAASAKCQVLSIVDQIQVQRQSLSQTEARFMLRLTLRETPVSLGWGTQLKPKVLSPGWRLLKFDSSRSMLQLTVSTTAPWTQELRLMLQGEVLLLPAQERCPYLKRFAIKAPSCPAQQNFCIDACVDHSLDFRHCGGCGKECLAQQACQNGQCANCASTTTLCTEKGQRRCVDTQKDLLHCGGCSTQCKNQEVCVKGRCQSCPPDTQLCEQGTARYCAGLLTSVKDCGGCGKKCGPNQRCAQGICETCPEGETLCVDGERSACIDLRRSPMHCGQCGKVCQSAQFCAQGQCRTCSSGQIVCGETKLKSCIDPQLSLKHCGTCNNTCKEDQQCVAGKCEACAKGLNVCRKGDRGQCVDLLKEQNNCGACGKVCPPNKRCSAGKCIAPCVHDRACPGSSICRAGLCLNCPADKRCDKVISLPVSAEFHEFRQFNVDAKGDLYFAGHFNKTLTFGTKTLQAMGSPNTFIAKRSSTTGNWLWAKANNDTGQGLYYKLVLDKKTKMLPFLFGSFQWRSFKPFKDRYVDLFLGDATPTRLKALVEATIYATKLDPAKGTVQWAHTTRGGDYNFLSSANTHHNGDLQFTFISNRLKFPVQVLCNGKDISRTTDLASPENHQITVRLDQQGKCLWARRSSGLAPGESAFPRATAVDTKGNTYTAGSFNKRLQFSTKVTLTAKANDDSYLASFDAKGDLNWAHIISSPGNVHIHSIITGPKDNIYVFGRFSTSITYEKATYKAPPATAGAPDPHFFAKIDASGKLQWMQVNSGMLTGLSQQSIVVDVQGDIFLYTAFEGKLVLSELNQTITSRGSRDLLLLRFDSKGRLKRFYQGGGTGQESPSSIDLGRDGRLYMMGRTTGRSTTLGDKTIQGQLTNQPRYFVWSLIP